jgi:hypothetical protein
VKFLNQLKLTFCLIFSRCVPKISGLKAHRAGLDCGSPKNLTLPHPTLTKRKCDSFYKEKDVEGIQTQKQIETFLITNPTIFFL